MSNQSIHIDSAMMDTENASNQEPTTSNRDLTRDVATGIPVVENTQDPGPPTAQVAVQGPNQVALHPTQHVLPDAAGAVMVDVPNAVLVVPEPPQPLVHAPEPVLAPMFTAPVPNGIPVRFPLMRALHGLPHIATEEEHAEDQEVQGTILAGQAKLCY
ncbi:hypothetical protein FRC12_004982 [Ceratobasidium sp. 428]|nr:hypothetical protein FRC12_004982 [Ceratobasidium sp. 428]